MKTVRRVTEIQAAADAARRDGKTIALVPTMGYLHAGHLSLVAEARRRSDLLVVSIFVNPTQFGPGEDLDRYPRDLERDEAMLREAGVDILFCPGTEEVYPAGSQTFVEVTELSKGLCGASRPGHFRGVATVVAKLFNMVKPHVAFFGEKDYQQLAVIRRMTRDLNFGVEIVGMPLVREEDGLAMSSRNVGLSAAERKSALTLNLALRQAQALVDGGERDAEKILKSAKETVSPGLALDYLSLHDPETLKPVDSVTGAALLAVAAKAGKTRLIDNIILTIKEEHRCKGSC